MADVSGARDTGNVGQTQRKIDIQAEILLLEPMSNPLTKLANLLGGAKTSDPKFTWYEDGRLTRTLLINNGAGYNTTDATFTVDTPGTGSLQVNDILKNSRTGEIMHVTSIGSATSVTVERAPNNSGTGVAILDDDELVVIGSAFHENATSRSPISNNATQKINYTQIFRDSVESSRTQMQADQYTRPNDWVHQNRKNAIEHNISKELAFWFGVASEQTSYSGGPLRTTDGVLNRISTNVNLAVGAMSETDWNGFLQTGSRYMSSDRMLFAAGTVIGALQGYPSGKLQVIDQARSSYGLDVHRFSSFFGSVNVVWEKLFDDTSGYAGLGVCLDTQSLKYRYLQNENGSSDTHVLTNRQANDQDGRRDEILSECGIQVPEEKKMFVVEGVTS